MCSSSHSNEGHSHGVTLGVRWVVVDMGGRFLSKQDNEPGGNLDSSAWSSVITHQHYVLSLYGDYICILNKAPPFQKKCLPTHTQIFFKKYSGAQVIKKQGLVGQV